MNQQPTGGVAGWLPDATAPGRNASSTEVGLLHAPSARAGADELLLAARRNARGLAIWVAACLALASLYLIRTPSEFVATTQVVLEEPRQTATGAEGQGGILPALDSARADSELQVVKSERNLSYVFDALDLLNDPTFGPAGPGLLQRVLGAVFGTGGSSPADTAQARILAFQNFSDRVGVRRVGQSYVLEVSFRAPDPAQAARLANAVTASYIRGQIEYRSASIQRGTEFLQNRIAGIHTELQVATDAVKQGAIPDMQFADADARVVSAALVPLGKSFPQSKLILVVVLLFALLSGIGVVAFRHSLDRLVRSRAQLAHTLGLDCLSVLPRDRWLAARRAGRDTVSIAAVLERPQSEFARTMRVLRAALFAAASQPRNAVVGVVSCAPREGRSTVAGNLASLLATSGRPVVLIDADLLQPGLTRALSPDAEVGLADMLSGHAVQAHLPEVPVATNLVFTPAIGQGRAADPNLFIGSPWFQQALLRARADRTVILDLPALNLSADTQALSHLLDGVVLVVEADRTSLDTLSEAIRALRGAEVRLLGVVLNKTTGSPRRGAWMAPGLRKPAATAS